MAVLENSLVKSEAQTCGVDVAINIITRLIRIVTERPDLRDAITHPRSLVSILKVASEASLLPASSIAEDKVIELHHAIGILMSSFVSTITISSIAQTDRKLLDEMAMVIEAADLPSYLMHAFQRNLVTVRAT